VLGSIANTKRPAWHRFLIPETTFGSARRRFSEKRLGAKAKSDIDVVVSGELQETDGAFDSPEYVLDAVSLGFPKGWIMLGHAISEDQIVV
jgi:hypothetical protein